MKLLVTGGVRSGKSAYALRRAEAAGERRAFVATAEIRDEEMRARVQRHQEERASSWRALEAPLQIADLLDPKQLEVDVVLVDCLTLWLSNLLESDPSDEAVLAEFRHLTRAISASPGPLVLVTNEVGFGIVPTSKLGRRFRDLAGILGQQVATVCDEVVLIAAGLPLSLKCPAGRRDDHL